MKTSAFAVSVQWGNGHHYFIRSDLATEEEARPIFDEHNRIAQGTKRKRGFKPQAFLWKRLA